MAVYVCAMEQGFRCRSPIALGENILSLELSPTGSQLLILTRTQVQVVDLTSAGEIRKREHQGWECLKADWVRGQIVTGSIDGSLSLLNLKNLEPMRTITGAPARSCRVALTSDGQHVIAGWETEARKQRVQIYSISTQASQPMRPVTIEDADYLVSGDSADAMWYVSSHGDNERELTPAGPSGEKITKRNIIINTGGSAVRAVSEGRSYVLRLGFHIPL